MHPCVFMLLWHSLEWEWKFLSCVQLFGTPWTMEFQSMEFSRPEHWSRQSLPAPAHFPKPGVETRSPALQADSSPAEVPAKPSMLKRMIYWAHWFKSSSHQETPSEALPEVIFNPGTPWAIQVDTKLAIAPRLFLFLQFLFNECFWNWIQILYLPRMDSNNVWLFSAVCDRLRIFTRVVRSAWLQASREDWSWGTFTMGPASAGSIQTCPVLSFFLDLWYVKVDLEDKLL